MQPTEAMGVETTTQIASRRRRPELRIALQGFLVTLAFLDCGVRGLGDRTIARTDAELEYRRRVHWMQGLPPHDVVFLGDSSIEEGISPAALLEQGVDAVNLGIPGATGIVALPLARAVPWRPRHVVLGGTPLNVLDGDRTPLPDHEAHLVSVFDPDAWHIVTADLLLRRLSGLYDRRTRLRGWLLTAASMHGFPRPLDPDDASQSFDAMGSAIERPPPYTSAERRHEAEVFARNFGRETEESPSHGTFARRALVAWSRPDSKRTLLIMPVAREWEAAFAQRASHGFVRDVWQRVALASDASLLDCSRAMPDGEFRSVDHLTEHGGRVLSGRMASWISDSVVPDGCERVR
jgi:hypothetical protein